MKALAMIPYRYHTREMPLERRVITALLLLSLTRHTVTRPRISRRHIADTRARHHQHRHHYHRQVTNGNAEMSQVYVVIPFVVNTLADCYHVVGSRNTLPLLRHYGDAVAYRHDSSVTMTRHTNTARMFV